MDKKLEDLIEVDESEYLEQLESVMGTYQKKYNQIAEVYNQYLRDRGRYVVNIYYNEYKNEYSYIKKQKRPIGFRGDVDA